MTSYRFRQSLIIALILLAPAIFVLGCGKSNNYGTNPGNNPPPPGNTVPHPVEITGFAFSPSSMSIAVGDTVTWRNDDNVGHTVTSNPGSELNSPLLSHGQTYMHVFNTAGSYPYHCTVHPSMTGTITVH